jgi:tetratricopeptide (TPR) repeat protein
MKLTLRNLSLLSLLALAACAGPPPCRPLDDEPGQRAPTTTCVVAPAPASPLERALRDYDAQRLAALAEDGDPRVAALAAHGLGEILRLEASVAEGQGDVARLEALTARRLDVARQGLDAVTTALAGSPDDADLMVARGELRAYLIDGFRAGLLYGRAARRELEAALAPHPLDPDARLAWAKQYYYLPATAGGDLDRARRDLEAIVADAPDHEPTWGFLGQVYLALGREAEARAALVRALCLNPRSLRGRAWLLRQEDLE